eukprot:13157004-Ditylum_brightwellii.AAC.2
MKPMGQRHHPIITMVDKEGSFNSYGGEFKKQGQMYHANVSEKIQQLNLCQCAESLAKDIGMPIEQQKAELKAFNS